MRMAKPISAPVPAQTRLFEHAPKWDSVDTPGGWKSACALILLYAAAAAASPAQTFTSLASFSGPNRAEPLSIVQGPDGTLCGTTFGGRRAGKLRYGLQDEPCWKPLEKFHFQVHQRK